MAHARRVTIFCGVDGEWRYRVQGTNWRTIEAPAIGSPKVATIERIVARRFPNVEVVITT